MHVIPRQPIILVRQSEGSYDTHGIYVSGVETQISILASVQPASPDDMKLLPEGRRQSRAFTIYSDVEILPATNQNPDQLIIFNERYEVMSCARWQNKIINHYASLVIRLDEQPTNDGDNNASS